MPAARRPSTALLSVLLLGLVVLGLLLKPIEVLACDLNDLGAAGAASLQVQVDAPDRTPDDGCCPTTNCGDCCVPAAAISTIAKTSTNATHPRLDVATPSSAFCSADSPVAIRPPIRS